MSPLTLRQSLYFITLPALWLVVFGAVPLAFGETPGVKDCPGFLYRSKKEGIPLYESPDQTSKVIRKLTLGEKVCRIGEVEKFQILRWETYTKDVEGEATQSSTVFARSVDLWEPRDTPGAKAGVVESAIRFFKLLFSGGMAEDPLLPYRPVMTPTPSFSSPAESCQPSSQESKCDQ